MPGPERGPEPVPEPGPGRDPTRPPDDGSAPHAGPRLPPRLRALWIRHHPGSALRVLRPEGRELGRCGEELAARALHARGWVLEGRNLPCPEGEVDLLARCGGQRVVVEVKTGRVRDPSPGDVPARHRPALRLDGEQLARLTRAARRLARGTGWPPRVDLVEVRVDARSGRWVLEHHADLRGVTDLPPDPGRGFPQRPGSVGAPPRGP